MDQFFEFMGPQNGYPVKKYKISIISVLFVSKVNFSYESNNHMQYFALIFTKNRFYCKRNLMILFGWGKKVDKTPQKIISI